MKSDAPVVSIDLHQDVCRIDRSDAVARECNTTQNMPFVLPPARMIGAVLKPAANSAPLFNFAISITSERRLYHGRARVRPAANLAGDDEFPAENE
jgi:hypothetical protein